MDRLNRPFTKFAAWMALHLMAYVAVAVSIRYLSYSVRIVEIAAIRSAGSLAIAMWVIWRNKTIHPEMIGLKVGSHVQRSLIHLVGSLALIWSVANLPLGFIATVEFSGPLFAALIGVAVAGRVPGPTASIGLAFIAVGASYLLLSQGLSQDASLLIPVGAVALLTTTNLMLARLAEKRSITLIIFVMHSVQLPIFIMLIALNLDFLGTPARVGASEGHMVDILCTLLAVLVLVVSGFVTQTALANASRHSTPLQLCAADTLRIPFLAMVGYLAFGEVLDGRVLLPGLLVVTGAIVASLPRDLARRREV